MTRIEAGLIAALLIALAATGLLVPVFATLWTLASGVIESLTLEGP
jgi:hypothetical protein